MHKNAHLHTHFRPLDTTYSFPPRVWDVIEQTLKLFKNLIQSKGLSISQKDICKLKCISWVMDELSFDNEFTIVWSVTICIKFIKTTLTKFETCSHKVTRAGAPSSPPFPQEHLPLSANQSPQQFGSDQWEASTPVTWPIRARITWSSRPTRVEGSSCPRGQRKLPAISGRQFKHGRGQLVWDGVGRVQRGLDFVRGRNPRCYKRTRMVGSVGSPMRSQSLARLHAVRAL